MLISSILNNNNTNNSVYIVFKIGFKWNCIMIFSLLDKVKDQRMLLGLPGIQSKGKKKMKNG
jgi:hypothetical protein